MKVVLVYNSRAGGYSSIKKLQNEFADASFDVIDSIKLSLGFESSLKPYIKKGEIIAVVGGDGSISAVASLLKDTNAILMPLPGGTLNHFTKDLDVPQSLPDALKYFRSAKKVKIDTGQVGDTTFINNSSIGLYSDALLDRDEHKKKYGKWPAMVIAILVAFFRFRTYNVEIDDKKYSTPLVFIGNNKYTLNGLVFRRSTFHQGVLSIYIIIGTSRWNLFWAIISLIVGQKNVSKKVKSFSTKNVVITAKRPMRVSRDGEHEKMTSPLKYRIKKSSLYILQGDTSK